MSTEKESTGNRDVEKCAVILLDIAGTTTSNSFIKDTLFPFAVSNAEEYLKSHWDEEVVKDAVKQLNEYNESISVSEVAEIIKTATEKDEDNKGVKTLQGLIYRQGYEDGKLKAPVFPDVSSSLESWSKNHRVAIYSSGSIESQKLLFAHTTEGDLSASVAQYFDLSVGPKADVSSYEKIAKELAVAPEEIVYINDDLEEAKAASQAGLKSILIIREGNDADIPEEKQKEFKVLKSFADLSVEASGKRKIEEEETAEEPPTKVAKTEEAEEVVRKAGEEEKNVCAEEEPMEIDSTNEVKAAGESELEAAANKDDENVMETDVVVKVTVENDKTEIETDRKKEDVALTEAVQKTDAEIEPVAADSQTNSDSSGKTPGSLSEKFEEGFSAKNESEIPTEKLTDSVDKDVTTTAETVSPPKAEIQVDACKTEKLTDSADKMEEDVLTTQPPPLAEIVSEKDTLEADPTEKDTTEKIEDKRATVTAAIEKETSETAAAAEKKSNSADKTGEATTKSSVTEMISPDTSGTEKPVAKMEDTPTAELPAAVIEKDTSKPDSTKKVTDSMDEMETEEPPRIETVEKKDTSKTDSIDKEEVPSTKPPVTVSTINEADTSKTDPEEKMDVILTTEPPQKEIVRESIERDASSKTDSAEKPTDKDTSATGDNSSAEEKTVSKDNTESNDKLHVKSKKEDASEIHIEVSEADDGGNTKETQLKVADKEMDASSTDTETKIINKETGDALMEVCETTEQNKTNNVEESHNKCKNICNKEEKSSESSKAESEHVNNEVESSTSTDAPVQTQECSSNEVRNESEKKTEAESTEENVVECEMKEIDGTEDKVNGNEAESSRNNDEKENKSELANGTTSVETGSDVNENGDVANATEEEIKVKKLEENPDSTAVSVEA